MPHEHVRQAAALTSGACLRLVYPQPDQQTAPCYSGQKYATFNVTQLYSFSFVFLAVAYLLTVIAQVHPSAPVFSQPFLIGNYHDGEHCTSSRDVWLQIIDSTVSS